MPLVQDHSCSECTKPYKPLADEPEIEDASPVKMVVKDGSNGWNLLECDISTLHGEHYGVPK